MKLLAAHGQTMEFISNQYRHCKTILALGASKLLLDKAGISPTLPSGEADSGVLLAEGDDIVAATSKPSRAFARLVP